MNYNDIVSSSLEDLGYEGSYNDKLYAHLVDKVGSREQLNNMLSKLAESKGVTLNELLKNFKDYIADFQYILDGIDDVILVDTQLFTGDVVEFDFDYSARSTTAQQFDVLLDGSDRSYVAINNDLNTWYVYEASIASVLVDGVPVSHLDPYVPTGNEGHIVITYSAPCSLETIGSRYTGIEQFNRGFIKNFTVTRANPTDQYPDLSWPINDGWGKNPVIGQTIPHSHKSNGTESYDSNGAVWVDYEIDPAPQYVGVTGYETLSERSALSGLSETGEAIASCREGAVVNGDFRFGDNGDWIPNPDHGGSYTIANGQLTSISNGNVLSGVDIALEHVLFSITEPYEVTVDVVGFSSATPRYYWFNGTQWANQTLNLGRNTIIVPAGSSLHHKLAPGTATNSTIVVSNIEARKLTEQQVLTRYVDNGELINGQESGWQEV